MYESLDRITTLDLAITSVCNAHCPDCARWWWTDQLTQHANPRDHHRNTHWPWRELCDHISVLPNIQRVLIVGNSGDPLTHPHVADIVDECHHQWPTAELHIDTNGSVGTAATWQRLAQCEDLTVTFSVDGLADTNSIYRQGVPWHRVVHNIQQFHQWGGRGEIKTIDWSWNLDQRDQIRDWAHDLGWSWVLTHKWLAETDDFLTEHTNLSKPTPWPATLSDQPSWHLTEWQHTVQQWVAQGRPMTPECKQDGDWLYINHDHRVWPCCYWAQAHYLQDYDSHQHRLLGHTQTHTWNSLDHHSLTDIIQDHRLSQLEQLWQGSHSDDASCVCIRQCGRCVQ